MAPLKDHQRDWSDEPYAFTRNEMEEATKRKAIRAIGIGEEAGTAAEPTCRRRHRSFCKPAYLDLSPVGTDLKGIPLIFM